MKINADVNVKNWLIKEYAIKIDDTGWKIYWKCLRSQTS